MFVPRRHAPAQDFAFTLKALDADKEGGDTDISETHFDAPEPEE
jgi:hypothetical protein